MFAINNNTMFNGVQEHDKVVNAVKYITNGMR